MVKIQTKNQEIWEKHFTNLTNLQNIVKSLGIFVFRKCFAADHQSEVLEPLLWNSRRTPLSTVTGLLFTAFRWCICAYHLSNSLESLLRNSRRTPLSTVTGLLFTAFRWCICAYHLSNSLESLLRNFYLTKLRLIRWPVRKILSQASESSLTATPIVLTTKTTLWSTYCEIVT